MKSQFTDKTPKAGDVYELEDGTDVVVVDKFQKAQTAGWWVPRNNSIKAGDLPPSLDRMWNARGRSTNHSMYDLCLCPRHELDDDAPINTGLEYYVRFSAFNTGGWIPWKEAGDASGPFSEAEAIAACKALAEKHRARFNDTADVFWGISTGKGWSEASTTLVVTMPKETKVPAETYKIQAMGNGSGWLQSLDKPDTYSDLAAATTAALDAGSRNTLSYRVVDSKGNALRTFEAKPTPTPATKAPAPAEVSDPINPAHYKSTSVEVVNAIEAWGLDKNFRLAHVIRYVARAGKKDPVKYLEDLKKAQWYLNREIAKAGG